MLIEEARQNYKDACASGNGHPPFEDLVGKLIDNGYSENFDNDSYFDALWLTHHMLNRTYKSVSIFTGSCGDEFLVALRGPFEAALDRIQKSGGTARLIVLNHKGNSIPFLQEMAKKYKDSFKFILATAGARLEHFIVCDKKMVRIEESHPDLKEDCLASVIKAKVNFNDPVTAKIREGYFGAIWDNLTKVLSVKKTAAAF